jgi:hypothetical protein
MPEYVKVSSSRRLAGRKHFLRLPTHEHEDDFVLLGPRRPRVVLPRIAMQHQSGDTPVLGRGGDFR